MWIKKSDDETQADRSRTWRRNCLAAVTLPLLVYAVTSSHTGWSLPARIRIPTALFAGFILLAWYQRLRWNRMRSTVQVCDQCNVVKSFDGKLGCPCGGKFLPLASMKWIDSQAHEPDTMPANHPNVMATSPV